MTIRCQRRKRTEMEQIKARFMRAAGACGDNDRLRAVFFRGHIYTNLPAVCAVRASAYIFAVYAAHKSTILHTSAKRVCGYQFSEVRGVGVYLHNYCSGRGTDALSELHILFGSPVKAQNRLFCRDGAVRAQNRYTYIFAVKDNQQ